MSLGRQRISHEEKERFLGLILPLRNRLVQYARAVTDTEEEREDLVGDTILAALQGFGRLEHEGAFPGWLFTIASRIQRKKRKRNKRFQRYDPTTDPETLPSRHRSPDVGPDIAMLYKAMGELPEKQREAIALHEISGLSLEEIREIQGGSLSGVKMRLSRGRRRLAELLGATEEGDIEEDEENTDQPAIYREHEQTPVQTARVFRSA